MRREPICLRSPPSGEEGLDKRRGLASQRQPPVFNLPRSFHPGLRDGPWQYIIMLRTRVKEKADRYKARSITAATIIIISSLTDARYSKMGWEERGSTKKGKPLPVTSSFQHNINSLGTDTQASPSYCLRCRTDARALCVPRADRQTAATRAPQRTYTNAPVFIVGRGRRRRKKAIFRTCGRRKRKGTQQLEEEGSGRYLV